MSWWGAQKKTDEIKKGGVDLILDLTVELYISFMAMKEAVSCVVQTLVFNIYVIHALFV